MLWVILVVIVFLVILFFIANFPIIKNSIQEKFLSQSHEINGITNNTFDIVISHYRNSISWLTQFKNLKNKNIRFFIYSKGNKFPDTNQIKSNFPKSEINLIKLDNIGMCDHTYLYHIIENYNDLADATYFLTDTADSKHKKDTFHIISKSNPNSEYLFPLVHNKLTYNFQLDHWTPTTQKNNGKNIIKLKPSPIRPYGKWFEEMTKSQFCRNSSYLGIFMASRNRIRRRDVSFYEKLIKQIDDTHCEVAHYIERLWYWIFTGEIVNQKKLGLLATVKNEEMIIREWIDHYSSQGVEHFYIIDCGSTDRTSDILINHSDVSYYCFESNTKSKEYYYNEIFKTIKNDCEWFITCNIDEYIYNRQRGRTIVDYLNSINSDAITLNAKVFTSNGFLNQPPSIRKYFTERLIKLKNHKTMIIKASSVISLNNDIHRYKGSWIVNPKELAFNNYYVMSPEYYKRSKKYKDYQRRKAIEKYSKFNYTVDNELKYLTPESIENKSVPSIEVIS
jgi:hypothetical protein